MLVTIKRKKGNKNKKKTKTKTSKANLREIVSGRVSKRRVTMTIAFSSFYFLPANWENFGCENWAGPGTGL
jgi:hypothetical protein